MSLFFSMEYILKNCADWFFPHAVAMNGHWNSEASKRTQNNMKVSYKSGSYYLGTLLQVYWSHTDWFVIVKYCIL